MRYAINAFTFKYVKQTMLDYLNVLCITGTY